MSITLISEYGVAETLHFATPAEVEFRKVEPEASRYAAGTSVTLSAAIAMGRSFGGWSGGCVGTRLSCTLPVNAATTVTATFN